MTDLRHILDSHVKAGPVPGAVALVARGDEIELAVAGSVDVEGTAPMARDSIFRIASTTKPIIAAAVMMLVDDGVLALDAPVATWLPEIAEPSVVRTPQSPATDLVAAARPITVFDLLTFRAGWGFPSDFTLPAVGLLFSELRQGPPVPHAVAAPDEWMAALGGVPLLHQPGEAWLYNTCSDIQGVLIARACGRPLPEFLAERIFEPLGMRDTGFAVPARDLDRFTSYYTPTPDGGLELADTPDGQWSSMPAFPSGAGGLVSTADDWLAFGRMLLAEGSSASGRRLLSAESVRLMGTDHLTRAQREASGLFIEGQGWGFGGSVDVEPIDEWNVPGRYGWVGGTGTAAHVIPATATVSILLTQVGMAGPTPPQMMRDLWRYAA
ncbi:CubicO group peptidase (beta-lactamase class C family) [Allocatelliglobosispora scoriae]|uniref:CubicO group peptidase (Beta-lactamase class C family) n=1 Tax=Allocatelliglobosispora scoriae TaxID=643052 RepID=A0A841BIZ1_9ACTN|nr:serine hydrolase domain-containing protein [Allocatelliglobosispora scoriae]MBB5867585.1 CubicO group peptidase (beta-lactamase class C family) [Allocatelliglobosispora scoriae]